MRFNYSEIIYARNFYSFRIIESAIYNQSLYLSHYATNEVKRKYYIVFLEHLCLTISRR